MTVRKSFSIAMLGAIGAFGMMQPTIQGSPWNYPSHDGHSVAHGKRLAAKARNVKRHKRAMKGGAK